MFSSQIKSVHFTGIGGTAMASAAAAMLDKGFAVTGSDQNVYEPMASFLATKKIAVMNGYDERNLAHKPDLVIIGNAISRGNPEVEYVLDHKLRYGSLSALLAEFFIRGKRSLVVTGTHGKTTTTSLLTWVFEHNGLNPSYLIGGIPNNFSQGARFTDSEWFIIEGDEYDTAFLTNAASSSITSRKSPSSTTWNTTTRTSLKTLRRSKKHFRISSGSCRETVCCWATAMTKISRRC